MLGTIDQGLAPAVGNADDCEYAAYVRTLQTHLEDAGDEPLFTVNTQPVLWEVYLEGWAPGPERQHHNCHACRRFIERYGSLVTIDKFGLVTSVFWHPDEAPANIRDSIARMQRAVESTTVCGPFVTDEANWGEPLTGSWQHMAVVAPKARIYGRGRGVFGASQRAAELRQDFINVNRALAKYTPHTVDQALGLLETEALYRAEKVIGPAKWLSELQAARALTKNKRGRDNIVWRAIALAPPGYAHPCSSMVGTLLDDIAAGLPAATVASRFAAKMSPTQYQRPTAAPTDGNIKQAERLIAEFGLEPALQRRYALLSEVQAVWRPVEPVVRPSGVFGHLAQIKEEPVVEGPITTVTWSKFARTALAGCESIEIFIHGRPCPFTQFVTAVHPDAPPLLQWDRPDARNQVSWYVYETGALPWQFSLAAGCFYPVAAICMQPNMWGGGNEHNGTGVAFLIAGAKDTVNNNLALFPEIIRSELREVRHVIAAHSRSRKLATPDGVLAAGLIAQAGSRSWDIRLRTKFCGRIANYSLDRWD